MVFELLLTQTFNFRKMIPIINWYSFPHLVELGEQCSTFLDELHWVLGWLTFTYGSFDCVGKALVSRGSFSQVGEALAEWRKLSCSTNVLLCGGSFNWAGEASTEWGKFQPGRGSFSWAGKALAEWKLWLSGRHFGQAGEALAEQGKL